VTAAARGLRILVTGSREWTDRDTLRDALMRAIADLCPPGAGPSSHPLSGMTLVHGAARGLDTLAAEQAEFWGMQVEAHPADWARHGRAAGPIRNAAMVALGADVCLAFPIGASPGTRGCIAVAERAGIPVVVHEGAPTGQEPPAVPELPTPAAGEAWARAVLARPDQVHVVDPLMLRALLDGLGDLRAAADAAEAARLEEVRCRTLGGTPPGYHEPGAWANGTPAAPTSAADVEVPPLRRRIGEDARRG
jgi:hypothetical protein